MLHRKIGLMGSATLVAMLSCEVAARVLLPAPPDPTRQPQIVYRTDPEVRFSLVPNQRGWIDDGFVTTNSIGFRGADIEMPKPAGRFRIVVLGDSVTFGWGVNDADTFCARMEQFVHSRMPDSDVEIVNLAVPGYGTRQEVVMLERYLARLQPNLVLLGFYANDVPDALLDVDRGAVTGTTVANAHAEPNQVLHMNPAPSTWAERQLRKSRAFYVAGHALKGLLHRGEGGKQGASLELDMLENRESPQLERAWKQVSAELGHLQRLSSTFGFSVGVVCLPSRELVMGLYLDSHYPQTLRSLSEREGFFVIDPLPSLLAVKGHRDTLFIPYDRNHPSAEGHRVIAAAIMDYLEVHEQLSAPTRYAARAALSSSERERASEASGGGVPASSGKRGLR